MRRDSLVRKEEKVQNKSDQSQSRVDEPMISTESVCEKATVGDASEQPAFENDHFTSSTLAEACVKQGDEKRAPRNLCHSSGVNPLLWLNLWFSRVLAKFWMLHKSWNLLFLCTMLTRISFAIWVLLIF